MDNTEAYGNAEEHGQKRSLIKQWVNIEQCCGWTCIMHQLQYLILYLNIHSSPQENPQKFFFGIYRWRSSAFNRSLAGTKWHFPSLNFYITVSEEVCETIVWIVMITILQQIGAKIYIQIFMTSFCVFSPLDGEVYINIFKNLPVVILQVNKSV